MQLKQLFCPNQNAVKVSKKTTSDQANGVLLNNRGGQAHFFKVRKSANSWTHQIRKFLSRASPQIANPQIFHDLSANRKSANFYKVVHNSV
jgi:hypothetical protein